MLVGHAEVREPAAELDWVQAAVAVAVHHREDGRGLGFVRHPDGLGAGRRLAGHHCATRLVRWDADARARTYVALLL